MKKQYISPTTSYFLVSMGELLVASSQGVNSDNYDIGYGGVDEDGTQVPGARRDGYLWDE